MIRVTQFFINLHSKTTMKHKCETDGCSSQSSISLESAPGSKNWSFKSSRSPGAVHPVVGDAHPCESCQDKRTCRLCSVNFCTAQHPGMISNSTTLVPGQVYDAIEGKNTAEPVPHPKGILKSGPSWRIHERQMPQLQHESESLDTPRCDPSPITPRYGLDRYASEDVINARSSELTRDLTRASTSQRRLSSVPATSYPIAAQDRGSSSSNQSEIRGAEYRLSLIRDKSTGQTESIEDEILQLQNQELHDIKSAGNSPGAPPPACSQCYNEHGYRTPSKKRFSLEELKDVTNFSLDSKFNGSKDDNLYRGELDGRSVFVARKETYDPSDYFPEVEILQDVRHPYIVTFRGYCDDHNSRALVFNFVCNGTLSYHLSSGNPKTMQWPCRVNLAVKIAEALAYLHGMQIIHGNVSSMNIFVTHEFEPVIGDFSFSRNIGGVRDVILQNRKADKKARGYLPPEYQLEYQAGRKLYEELDIYAFGVVLFELICGRAPFYRENKTKYYLGEWGREKVKECDRIPPYELVETMVDPRLTSCQYDKDEMLKMINLAAQCTSKDPKGRPLISKVLKMLTGEKDTKPIHKQAPPSSERLFPPPISPSGSPPAVPRRTLVTETGSSSEPSAPSPAAPRRTYSADQDTLVVETGSTMRSTDNDHNPAEGLQLLRDQVPTAKCKPLNNNCERAQQAAQNRPEERCCSRRTNSASKPPVSPDRKPDTKTRPPKTTRYFCPPWSSIQRRPNFCPPWKPTPKRPPTPGHVLVKKKNRSSHTHHPGSVSSTSTQHSSSSPKNSSSRAVSHSNTLRRISMSPLRHMITVSWYYRKSGGENFEDRSERKEHRVTWKRRPRPNFLNLHFSFNNPD